MPPRTVALRLRAVSTAPTSVTRPQCLCEILSSRQFHTSPRRLADDDADAGETRTRAPKGRRRTRLRRDMFQWLEGTGKKLKDPLPGSTNYVTAYDNTGRLKRDQRGGKTPTIDVISEEEEPELQRQEEEDGVDEADRAGRLALRQRLRKRKAEMEAKQAEAPQDAGEVVRPFPLNPFFRSEAVLSQELREEIYRQVADRGADITSVSAAFGVDIRRVAAVVRLMAVEKQWVAEGKKLAKPYNNAVLAMLPKTPFSASRITPHESINDLFVHPSTRKQLFLPTSESRHFTREDAARAFSPILLPADKRIPHPELITLERQHLEGLSFQERIERQAARDAEAARLKLKAEEKKARYEAEKIRVVSGRRWDFKFEDISVEKAGRDGRGRSAVGVRYGTVHMDRKRGQVKIPTKVE